jgi:hypothetical protein
LSRTVFEKDDFSVIDVLIDLFRAGFFERFLTAQPDLTLSVDLENLDHDFIALFEHVGDFAHALWGEPTSASAAMRCTISMAFRAATSSLDAMVTVPSSSTSILTPVASMMPRMTFPPGPMISRILSGLTLKVMIRGA